MCPVFGKYNFDSQTVGRQELDRARLLLAPYGPDGEQIYCKGNLAIVYRGFHTIPESGGENQPFVTKSEAVITWDGRLDNRDDVAHQLGDPALINSPDLEIVAAAYERWGAKCLSRLIGDWAFVISDIAAKAVLLATDHLGIRRVYYSVWKNHLLWSTALEPLVLLAEGPLRLCEEYLAGWIASFPAPDLTPYSEIRSVLPGSYVRIHRAGITTEKYWTFDPAKKIRYRVDSEYEEHFRVVLEQSVRRRLRSCAPVLAELSGGMDSSAIVCMADLVAARSPQASRVDTLSFFDDTEPNWNERPYFTEVEEARGRRGFHIDASGESLLSASPASDCFVPAPGATGSAAESTRQFAAYLRSKGIRVVLSGLGGDEVLGGVPTPLPELADLLSRLRLKTLGRQLKQWALAKRSPWLHLLIEATSQFAPLCLRHGEKAVAPPSWLIPAFARRQRLALTNYPRRTKLFGPLPSFQYGQRALFGLCGQLGCLYPACDPPYEVRYPFLDRDLLEFLFAIPREQLVRPSQRRSLMRRALTNIVPNQVLERRRKAFVIRGPLKAISSEWPKLEVLATDMISASLGLVDGGLFLEALGRSRHGVDVSVTHLTRTIELESWLRQMEDHSEYRAVVNVRADASDARKTEPGRPAQEKPYDPGVIRSSVPNLSAEGQ